MKQLDPSVLNAILQFLLEVSPWKLAMILLVALAAYLVPGVL